MRNYIVINNNLIFPTLVAETYEQQAKGLMFQKAPQPIMSFPYKKASINKFWMKNCPDHLDIVFALNNKIVDIKKGEAYSTNMIGSCASNLVVEFPYGTMQKFNIQCGDSINLISSDQFWK